MTEPDWWSTSLAGRGEPAAEWAPTDDWLDDDWDPQERGPGANSVGVGPAGATTVSVDVAGAAAALVDAAVQEAVRRRVAAIVDRAVASAFENSDLASALDEQARDLADVAVSDQLTPHERQREPGPEAAAQSAPHGQDAAPELFFGSVDQFVRGFLRHVYSRRISGRTARVWAPDWWRYPEAVSRLESLWRAWEALRLDPATGMSVWWRDHADHHMNVLLDAEGPFTGVDSECATGAPLPCSKPPPALFPDVRVQSTPP